MSGPKAVVDTNIFITARNPTESGFRACRNLIDRIDRGEVSALLSAVTIAELRAGILQQQVQTLWRPMLRHFLTSPNYRVEPVDSDIAEAAGELRASDGLTNPDAIVVATAQLRGAKCVVTQDVKLLRRRLRVSLVAPNALP